MIKTLNEKELEMYINNAKIGLIRSVVLYLSNPDVEYWISSKKFAMIKKELSVYNNIKFGCMHTTNGCKYYFFTPSKDAEQRIVRFFAYMADHKKPLPLMSVPENYVNTWTAFATPDGGSYNTCPLFN